MNVFKSSPLQSATLNQENVPPPGNIMNSDLENEVVMDQKRQRSREYSCYVKSKRASTDGVTMSDVAESREHDIAMEVASLVPKIAQNCQLINNNEIIAAIQDLGASLHALRAQTNRIEDKLFNSSAHNDGDFIRPPMNIDGQPIPDNFPTTILALRLLNTNNGLVNCEQYYGVAVPAATVALRRAAIFRAYNVGLITTVSTVTTVRPV